MMTKRCLLTAMMLVMSCGAALADNPPAWLQQAAGASHPAYGQKVRAVVLHDEQTVKVEEDGRVTTTTRYAVKVLTRAGREEAVARESYITNTERVREMRAWMIRPSGAPVSYGKDRVMDVGLSANDVYNEARGKLIIARDDAEIGSVFGFETTTESRSVFTQFAWHFQSDLPALVSRFALTLPIGWQATGVTFNHAPVAPQTSGGSSVWELRNLDFIEEEAAAPNLTNLAPRLAVSFFPGANAKNFIGRSFTSWREVSAWLSELSDTQAEPNDALAAKARALTANAKTEFEKIQAIGRYAQSINYISVQTNIGRGGGYRPHAAAEVFSKSYGDCKDKANLMRAMLRAVNIPAYLVSIYSGDPNYVREEWPSPQQFNHCIVAVKICDETNAPAVVNHPKLGRLLIFDATDEYTPVGDLPDHEQNSFALIVAGADGALLKMPGTPAEANRVERQTEVTLTAEGAIKARVSEQFVGQPAAHARGEFRRHSREEFGKKIERWIARTITGAAMTKLEPQDEHDAGRFALRAEFAAEGYAKSMNGRLLVFNPVVVARCEVPFNTEDTRRHPLILRAQAKTETVRVALPAGFEVDEAPEPAQIETPFGKYSTKYEFKDGHLLFTRSLTVNAATVPASEYAAARDFFKRVCGAEQAMIVLAKK